MSFDDQKLSFEDQFDATNFSRIKLMLWKSLEQQIGGFL